MSEHSLRNSVGIGSLGELAVRKELHKQGYNVYIPQCDNDGVDMVVEHRKHNTLCQTNKYLKHGTLKIAEHKTPTYDQKHYPNQQY